MALYASTLAFCLVSSQVVMGRDHSVVPPGVRKQLQSSGSAAVHVSLVDDSTPRESLKSRCSRYARKQYAVLSKLPAGSCALRYRYRYSPTLFLSIHDKSALDTLESSASVRSVTLDAFGRASMLESRVAVRANQAVTETGITGRNTIVAVLDQGADPTHPDLDGAILHEYHFLDRGADVGPEAMDGDEFGHGIHVTGIIGSRGAIAEPAIAPETAVLAIKVLQDDGGGWASDWAAGVEHVTRLHETGQFDVDAIHMSLGTEALFQGPCDDKFPAFAAACGAAAELGITIVASAGNQSTTSQLEAPGCFSSVISVSSVLDTAPDTISDFANRGPLLDLFAPSESITSSGPNAGIITWKGTSQAAPHVTGLVCLLRELSPNMSPPDLRRAMQITGIPVLDNATGRIYPRIDVYTAVTQLASNEDCDESGTPDFLEIITQERADCDGDLILDVCQIAANEDLDCDFNGVLDACEGVVLRCHPLFRHGDTTFDDLVDVTDALESLGFVFLGEPATLRSFKSADVNDDVVIDISDAISLVRFLFLGTAPPTAPFPHCGGDPTPDNLPCDVECTP